MIHYLRELLTVSYSVLGAGVQYLSVDRGIYSKTDIWSDQITLKKSQK